MGKYAPCRDCKDTERPGITFKFKETPLGGGAWQLSKSTRYCVDCAERAGLLSFDEAADLRKRAVKAARLAKESR